MGKHARKDPERLSAEEFIHKLRTSVAWTTNANYEKHEFELIVTDERGDETTYLSPDLTEMDAIAYDTFLSELRWTTLDPFVLDKKKR